MAIKFRLEIEIPADMHEPEFLEILFDESGNSFLIEYLFEANRKMTKWWPMTERIF